MSKIDKSTQLKKDATLKALEASMGIVTTACKTAGISRSVFYQWLENDPEFKKAVEDVDNVCLDFAESSLMQQIKDHNTTATIFYLKTKGRHRGYVERVEVSSDGFVLIKRKNKKDE